MLTVKPCRFQTGRREELRKGSLLVAAPSSTYVDTMSGGDRLSVLPDDLLRRVLYFAPAREGASTSALSKRWRGLWRSSGSLNLDAHIPDREEANFLALFSWRDAFVSAARLSLEAAAADFPVTRLTFRVIGGSCRDFLYSTYDNGWKTRSPDVVTELLSLPAARRIKELRLAAGYAKHFTTTPLKDEETKSDRKEFWALSFFCLPSDTLRLLDVNCCDGFQPTPGVAFPRLVSLRLSHCSVWSKHLQEFIHAAPMLTTVHLESVTIRGESPENAHKGPSPAEGFIIRLHCPAATELVLDRCCWLEKYYHRSGTVGVEIDAPRLRRFKYHGLLRQLALISQAPHLARVDLHIFFLDDYCRREKDVAGSDLVTFWRLAQNFTNAKELKLRVNMLEDIAVVDLESRAKLLCSFHNLKRLHLEGMHRLKGKTAAVAIANLLWCCPVLCDLRINLTMAQPDMDRGDYEGRSFLEEKYQHDLEKSIHGFNNRRLEAMVPVERDYGAGDVRYDKLSVLPDLSSGHVFDCLLNTLSCVRLQFRLEMNIFELKLRSNFATKLIKFFAENAAVLKEMHIDDGNGKMCDHMNGKLEKWVRNSSEKRKTTFVVLPLES